MLDKRIHLDERTSIPLALVVGSLPVIIGSILWLATIDSKASGAQEDLRGVKQVLLDVQEKINDTREMIVRIEAKLNRRKEY